MVSPFALDGTLEFLLASFVAETFDEIEALAVPSVALPCSKAVCPVVSRTAAELLLIAISFVSESAKPLRADRFVIRTFEAALVDSLVKLPEKMELLLAGRSLVSETKIATSAPRTDVLLVGYLVVLTGTFEMLLAEVRVLSMDGAFQLVLVGISAEVLALLDTTNKLVLSVKAEELLILIDSLCSLMLNIGASVLYMAELLGLLC